MSSGEKRKDPLRKEGVCRGDGGIVDTGGTITLRHAGKLKHLGIGRAHARTEVICLVHGHKATVITHGGDVIAEFVINPEKDYQAKNS